ncbi:SusC/RagA family TonB-linked outer membrane protein [Adhaeribacter aquaticus]|uniref:SusC/RagA family TonB-linked outer membrane protein n=1 Tax=Adhaeribacter aquaticus TaxID=299567 RepID=UPI00047E5C70|nr:TonB-dependent receptor [Adhaeribacter aquaticus]
MKYLLILPLVLMALIGALAQGIKVGGKVLDEKGAGMPGVTVLVKGTTNGTSTDVGGNFTLTAPNASSVLVVSFIGYLTKEVPLSNRTNFTIGLVPDQQALEEVVVIGYQAVPRSQLTSSVSSVGDKQLKDIPVSTAGEALAGRLAGVQVTTSEGQPGAEISIRVRGGTSITGSNTPLYIVDGIQVDNALSFLTPQEIQSIDVLKDAASTAIYGARGANGVVVITTKGGREMKTQVTYNGFTGVRKITNELEVMNPYDFVKYQYQVYNLNQNEESRNSFLDRYGRYEDLDLYRNMPATNWQQKVFGRSAKSQTHIIGITGGTKTTSFNFNLNRVNEEGIMLNSGFERTLASFKFDHKINDRFKIGLTNRFSRQKIEGVGTSSSGTQGTNRLRNSVRFRPFVAPGLENQVDEFDPNYFALTNLTSPVLLANQELRYDYRNDIIVNGWASYELLNGLTLKTQLGVTNTTRDQDTFNGAVTAIARQNNGQPVVQQIGAQSLSLTNSNTLTYTKKFGKSHAVNFLLGQEIWQTNAKSRNITTKWLPIDITPEQAFTGIQQATPPPTLIQDAPTTGASGERLLSFFSSVNYSLFEKYRATISVRRDASSLFAPENRIGYFPSVALAWHVSDESFMAGTKAWLSDMKVRASLGAVGNNRIGLDLWKTMFASSSNDGYAFTEAITPGYTATYLANRNLKWETTISRNLGLDMSFLNNRLTASVDVYKNSTNDLLLRASIPSTSGYQFQQQNVGSTENKGVELQLGGMVMEKGDFNWNANFNIAFNRNKIVSLGKASNGQALNSYAVPSGWITATYEDFLVQVGQPVGQFYGYLTDGYYAVEDFELNNDGSFKMQANGSYTLKEGVANSRNIALGNRDPQPGDLKLKDITNDGNSMINTNDRTVLGNAQPKFIGGLNQQFAYKGFDLSLFMNFSVGNKVYNANKIEFTTLYEQKDNNMLALMNDRWKWYDENGARVTNPEQLAQMNKDTRYWTPARGQYFLHSFAIEDGSFLRISNLTLGYSLPENLVQRTKAFSKVRVYTTVNNLITLTGYSGYDPEANTRRSGQYGALTPGVDYAAYPRSRYILGGVNITF